MNTNLIRPGEILVALGLIGIAFCAMLSHLVMLGLLALPGFPIALGFALIGVLRARNRVAAMERQVGGFLLLLVGIAGLVFASVSAVDLARDLALHSQRPGRPAPLPQEWLMQVISSIFPALLVGLGLRLWTNWSNARCALWSGAVLITPAAALIVYRSLAQWLPIDA